MKVRSLVGVGAVALVVAIGITGCGSNTAPYTPAATIGGSGSGGGMPNVDVDTGTAGTGVIAGTITYRQAVVLPKDARVVVSLVRLSGSGGSVPVAQHATPAGGQVPLRFELHYDPSRLSGGSYGVQARILVDGAVWFVTATPTPVQPNGGTATVQLEVQPAGSEADPMPGRA